MGRRRQKKSKEKEKRETNKRNRRAEQREKKAQKARKERQLNRRRRTRRRMIEKDIKNKNDEGLELEWKLNHYNTLYEEMLFKMQHIDLAINHFEDQITKIEQELMAWDETESDYSWNMRMEIIWNREEKIWKLKELRDDIFHHLWLLDERRMDISVKIQKLKLNELKNDQNETSSELVANDGDYSLNRRRLGFLSSVFDAVFSFLKRLVKALSNAIAAIGTFISKIGDLLVKLGQLIVKLVEALIALLSALFKVLLLAFKADVRGVVDVQVTVDFAVKMSVFFVPIEFCIHLSFGDLEDGLKDAADKTSDSHTNAEKESKYREEALESDSKGNTHQVAVQTPAPLKQPNVDPPLQPRSGLPNLGLALDSNWCEVF